MICLMKQTVIASLLVFPKENTAYLHIKDPMNEGIAVTQIPFMMKLNASCKLVGLLAWMPPDAGAASGTRFISIITANSFLPLLPHRGMHGIRTKS
ncbi:hypothetical protein SS50_17980 [Enterobacter chengduensis]|nr:hypothetical protein SS50_17980 [Enterobacter chengduensis]